MSQGICVDSNRDFCDCHLGLVSYDESADGITNALGYLKTVTKLLERKNCCYKFYSINLKNN